MCDLTFKKIWEGEVQRTQNLFFYTLRRNGYYHSLKSPWQNGLEDQERNYRHRLLKTKVLFGFFGFPFSEQTGYDHKMIKFAESVINILRVESRIFPKLVSDDDNAEYIQIAFVILLMECNRKTIPVPVLRFESNDGNKFIDSEGEFYQNWIDFELRLESRTEDQCYRYCCPRNGTYKDDGNDQLDLYFIIGGHLSSDLKQIPQLKNPNEKRLNKLLCMEYCFSELFFFNRFIEPESVWEMVLGIVRLFLDSMLENFDSGSSEKSYWQNNWGNILLDSINQINAFFCLKNLNLDKISTLITFLRECNIHISFEKSGFIKLNDEIIMDPVQLVRLEKEALNNISSCLEQNKTNLELKLGNENVKMFFISKVCKNKTKIGELLGKRCSFLEDKINIRLYNNAEFSDYIRLDQIKKLYRILTKREGNIIKIVFLLMEDYGCTTVKDLIRALEIVILLKKKDKTDKKNAYDSARIREIENKNRLNKRFNLKDFNKDYGIPENLNPDLYFQQQIVKELEKNIIFRLDELKWQCMEHIKNYNFQFSDTWLAVLHYVKHGKKLSINPNPDSGTYFQRIQRIMNLAPEPELWNGSPVEMELIFEVSSEAPSLNEALCWHMNMLHGQKLSDYPNLGTRFQRTQSIISLTPELELSSGRTVKIELTFENKYSKMSSLNEVKKDKCRVVCYDNPKFEPDGTLETLRTVASCY